MIRFIDYIKEYSKLLREGAVWHNSNEILAPVIGEVNEPDSADNYVYEFYCYISIVIDLMSNYDIVFVEGEGPFKYKFPQAASNKKGKPRFHAKKNDVTQFQICAGTKIKGKFESENNHPDISFQDALASEEPNYSELILIMDAKFKEGKDASLPKNEIYKFGVIVDLFSLRNISNSSIQFNRFTDLKANCLLTNGDAYSRQEDIAFLQYYNIKEVEHFGPDEQYNVIG